MALFGRLLHVWCCVHLKPAVYRIHVLRTQNVETLPLSKGLPVWHVVMCQREMHCYSVLFGAVAGPQMMLMSVE